MIKYGAFGIAKGFAARAIHGSQPGLMLSVVSVTSIGLRIVERYESSTRFDVLLKVSCYYL